MKEIMMTKLKLTSDQDFENLLNELKGDEGTELTINVCAES